MKRWRWGHFISGTFMRLAHIFCCCLFHIELHHGHWIQGSSRLCSPVMVELPTYLIGVPNTPVHNHIKIILIWTSRLLELTRFIATIESRWWHLIAWTLWPSPRRMLWWLWSCNIASCSEFKNPHYKKRELRTASHQPQYMDFMVPFTFTSAPRAFSSMVTQ